MKVPAYANTSVTPLDRTPSDPRVLLAAISYHTTRESCDPERVSYGNVIGLLTDGAEFELKRPESDPYHSRVHVQALYHVRRAQAASDSRSQLTVYASGHKVSSEVMHLQAALALAIIAAAEMF